MFGAIYRVSGQWLIGLATGLGGLPSGTWAQQAVLTWHTQERTVLGSDIYLIHAFNAKGPLVQLLPQVQTKFGQRCGSFERYMRVEQTHYFLTPSDFGCLLHVQGDQYAYHGVLSIREQLSSSQPFVLQAIWQDLGWRVTWQHCESEQPDIVPASPKSLHCVVVAAADSQPVESTAFIQALKRAQWHPHKDLPSVWLGPEQQRLTVYWGREQQHLLVRCQPCH